MSGSFALPFVLDSSGSTLGWMPIAPAGWRDHRDRLGELGVPTLVLWGSADKVFPVGEGEELAAAIAGARLLLFEGASHPCYLDQPERFHDELVTFVKRLATREQPARD